MTQIEKPTAIPELDSAEKLLRLARAKFGKLSNAEELLCTATANGEIAHYGYGDPTEADNWSDDRVLKADRLVWLCTDREAAKYVTFKGVRIRGVRVDGEIDLRYARIDFPLEIDYSAICKTINLSQAHLYLLNLAGTHTGAIYANAVKISKSLYLRNGFIAEGEVNLIGAEIGGQLSCVKGHFSNPDGIALNANSIKVKGHVILRDGFKAEGVVDFSFSIIQENFEWVDVNSPEKCTLSLKHSTIGTLIDLEKDWPPNIDLDGFVYDRIGESSPTSADDRLRWIKRQNNNEFLPQPYEQLAKVLKEMGHENYARQILIAKQEDPALLKSKSKVSLFWHNFLGDTIGYGYEPWRALWLMLLFIIFGALIFYASYHEGQLIPTKLALTNTKIYPEYYSLVYSLDAFVPLIDLQQAKYRLPVAFIFQLYLWVHISCGWLLTTLLAVALTGKVRK